MVDSKHILDIFPDHIRSKIIMADLEFESLQEIRMRVNAPLILIINQKEYVLTKTGKVSENFGQAYYVTPKDIKDTMALVSDYSMYAYEDEIRQGYITIKGGHRVGIAGKIILEDHQIKTMKYISFINIRIAHQIKGCALPIMPYIYQDGHFFHTLIISPPCCGKTTMLRDIIRFLSESEAGISIGVVDERSEVAACYMGIPQNDVGFRADILDGCPKAEGMLMLLRSMSPQLIAVDEIGSREDLEAIEYVINCGCKLLATVHGNSIDELMSKPILGNLMRTRIFERYIVLNNCGTTGHVEAVYDAFGSNLLYS